MPENLVCTITIKLERNDRYSLSISGYKFIEEFYNIRDVLLAANKYVCNYFEET